jgi:hypothetical protein
MVMSGLVKGIGSSLFRSLFRLSATTGAKRPSHDHNPLYLLACLVNRDSASNHGTMKTLARGVTRERGVRVPAP